MQDTTHKLQVLSRMSERFSAAGVTWAVGASLLLYFHAIVETFNDIDVMTTMEDAETVRGILSSMGTLNPPNPKAQYGTKCFLEFEVDGVDVDVMAGFSIVDGGQEYDCSLRREQIAEYATVNGARIPLQSVALWREYYRLMHRDAKVALIDGAAKKESKISKQD